ncbi:antibiotic biosynthesis monooxygenase family protein [Maribacter sp. CXY002]|uniref:antibiotic biosynthesis monooxygenase family protein n=1 Tax=Maribacter luteocoastalis TaxID=3407671 RepID=UPI003B67A7EF
MILEIATFDVKPNHLNEFKEATHKAKAVISQSKGFLNLDFKQCMETETKFVALISWETLQDHTIGFRESELFIQWRAIMSPYFNTPPVAEHFQLI